MKETQQPILKITIDEFKLNIQCQIDKGLHLQEQINCIKTILELEHLQNEFEKWNFYNCEYLKTKFNEPLNDYKYDYEQSGRMIGVEKVLRGADINNPNYKFQTLNERINAKTKGLEKILQVADLLVVENSTNNFSNNNIIEIKKEIIELISQNKTEKCFAILIEYFKHINENEKLNSVVILSGSYNNIKELTINMLIEHNYRSIEINKINKSILSLLD